MAEPGFAYTILVVDDEPGIIQLCKRLLERAGFKVIAVTTPSEGINILERESVDLLLADIRMPEIDGFQLIDRTRNIKSDLAVVVMTGYGTIETAIESLRRGADGLVLKPFAGADLVQSIQSALEESQRKQDVMRLQTLRPLFDITETLYAETDPGHLQELLLSSVRGHLRCSFAGLYQKKTDESVFRLVAGLGELSVEEESDPDHSVIGRADAWKSAICVNRDGQGDPVLQSLVAQRGLASLMAAPMVVQFRSSSSAREENSILVAARSAGEAPFRNSDLEFFAILSRQAAVARENASLHSELRAYIHRVEESQRALILAEKMAIAGRLTASIAHEINNPLQSLQNCLHLTSRKELPAEDRQNYLNMAQAELERLMHTVQQMLDYYRPAAVERQPVDINELIKRVLSLLEQQLQGHAIRAQVEYAPKLPAVWVVADQIQQVILNLFLNAMEAMPGGGEIFIEIRETGDGVEIIVEDTGPGINKDQWKRIFEPFFSTKKGGTGLGLAISYGIVSAHGGTLDLIQGKRKGACFRVELPSRELI